MKRTSEGKEKVGGGGGAGEDGAAPLLLFMKPIVLSYSR